MIAEVTIWVFFSLVQQDGVAADAAGDKEACEVARLEAAKKVDTLAISPECQPVKLQPTGDRT